MNWQLDKLGIYEASPHGRPLSPFLLAISLYGTIRLHDQALKDGMRSDAKL